MLTRSAHTFHSMFTGQQAITKRIKHLLPVYARKIYVTTMVIPILEYASTVWGDKNNKVLMDSIQVLRNRAAKMVLERAPHLSSTKALADLNWVNLPTRKQMQCCLYMYNLINENNRNNMIIRGLEHHSHNTRSKDTIRIIKSNTNWGLLSSLNSALLDWNALPMEMRNLSYIIMLLELCYIIGLNFKVALYSFNL